MLKRFFTIVLFLVVVAGGLVAVNHKNTAHAVSEDWVCRWYTGGEIECRAKTDLGNLQVNILTGATGTLLEAMTFGSVIDATGIADWGIDGVKEWERTTLTNFDNLSPCVAAAGNKCTKFFFQPDQSKTRGYPVFCYVDSNGNLNDGGDEGCLHFVSQNPLTAYHTGANAALSGVPADGPNWYPIGGVQNADQPAVNNECSVVKTGNCKPHNKPDFNETGLDATAFTQNIEAIQALDQLKALCNDEAPLPFIFCPVFEGIISGISSLIGGQNTQGNRDGLLIRFLTIQPLSTSSPTVLSGMLSSVITIANLFYVVIFLLIIFSSSLPLGLDNYTIKKMLPKFIAAVIMTQFAYVICGIVIDFFNLLGVIVPNIIFSLPLGTNLPTPGGATGTTPGEIIQVGLQGAVLTNFAAGAVLFVSTVGWILILVLGIIALVAIVVAFIYIVLRYLIIYILILISPLAFAAWVLPGTEKFFSGWWKNFIRVNAVFPMITGMLAVSIILSRVLVTQGAGSGGVGSPADPALALIGLVLPIVALFLIPKTLKWTTQGMNALAAGALGFAAGKMGAGAKAVGKGAQTAGKKGYSYGKDKGIDFGKRKGVEFLGRRGFSNTAIEREKGRQLSDERKKGDLRYSNMDLDQASASLNRSMAALAKNPHDIKAQADVHAGLARLNQLGGAGRKKIGIAQNQFRAAGGAYSTWASALGDSGVFGDLDEKSPELTLDWSSQPAPAGAPPGTPPSPPAAFFSEDGIRNVNITNGNQSITTLTSTDVSKKGAPDLGSLGSTTVQSMADIDTGLEAVQYGQHINWQAAATMASTPQMHPKDATTIQHWQKVGQRGVQYWENVGNQAAAAGNQALFDQATQNQAHAQAIVDGFGG